MDDPTVYENTILGTGTLLEILAWRICFWSGLLIGLLGIYIRRTYTYTMRMGSSIM